MKWLVPGDANSLFKSRVVEYFVSLECIGRAFEAITVFLSVVQYIWTVHRRSFFGFYFSGFSRLQLLCQNSGLLQSLLLEN
jgi:hypothetical protein